MSILIVGETPMVQRCQALLAEHGLNVALAQSSSKGLEFAKNNAVALLIIMESVPSLNAQLPSKFRKAADSYILVMVVRDKYENPFPKAKVQNLIFEGVDAYITERISEQEFFARVQALLRRPHEDAKDLCAAMGLENLSKTELLLARSLLRQEGSFVSKEELIRAVWGERGQAKEESLRFYIWQLRRKLGRKGIEILNLKGMGYALKTPKREEEKK